MEVFDCYVQCNLAGPDGIRGITKNGDSADSDSDDINDTEDSDRIRYKEVLATIGKSTFSFKISPLEGNHLKVS